jgi:protein involved in polysaccharide export with SLBB domain
VLKRFPLIFSTAVFVCGAALSNGADNAYRLFVRDVVTLGVYGEPDMTAELRIAGNGMINVPLLGNVHVVGLNLTAAERKIEQAYIEQQIFIRPQITLQVKEYSKKEVSILGQIGKQGKVELPPESVEMNIVNAVSLAGGFTRIAKSDSVSVTRTNPETGEEKTFTVNVEQMIAGRSKESVFYVIPGDIVFVPERLF